LFDLGHDDLNALINCLRFLDMAPVLHSASTIVLNAIRRAPHEAVGDMTAGIVPQTRVDLAFPEDNDG